MAPLEAVKSLYPSPSLTHSHERTHAHARTHARGVGDGAVGGGKVDGDGEPQVQPLLRVVEERRRPATPPPAAGSSLSPKAIARMIFIQSFDSPAQPSGAGATAPGPERLEPEVVRIGFRAPRSGLAVIV